MARALHFLVRYSDNLTGVDTVAEHRTVIATRGAAWFGKFGVGCSAVMIDKAKKQVVDGVPTFVYLESTALGVEIADLFDFEFEESDERAWLRRRVDYLVRRLGVADLRSVLVILEEVSKMLRRRR